MAKSKNHTNHNQSLYLFSPTLELDRLHNYPIVTMPIVNVSDCLLKCLLYRGDGKDGQFIKVNYHIQSRHG